MILELNKRINSSTSKHGIYENTAPDIAGLFAAIVQTKSINEMTGNAWNSFEKGAITLKQLKNII